jgi:enamine deaminase RidA (YjgF/YER057c/UK114 family)
VAKMEIIHLPEFDPEINSLFVPAIRVGDLLYLSGVYAAPPYHHHPHRESDFESIPKGSEQQARLTYGHLKSVLEAAGSSCRHIVSLTRFLTNLERDQDVVNRVQAEFLGGHLPTSTTVEIGRLAAQPDLLVEIHAVAVVADGSDSPV